MSRRLAEQHYHNKEYSEAEREYLKFVNKHNKYSTLSIGPKIACCQMKQDKYEEAGDTLVNLTKDIVDSENKLMSFSIEQYTTRACLCYLLACNETKFEKTLASEFLNNTTRAILKSRGFSLLSVNDFDDKYLVGKLTAQTEIPMCSH